MNPAALFRNWVDPFDRWHLWLVPPTLIGLIVALVLTPSLPTARPPIHPPSTPPPTQSIPTTPSSREGSAMLVPTPPNQPIMRPTRIESPAPNTLFWRDRLGDVEGIAEPGSLVRLFWSDKLIGQTTADADGRYRFGLRNFPPGQHQVQVIATLGRSAQASPPSQFVVKAERAPKTGKKSSSKTTKQEINQAPPKTPRN